MNPLKKKSESGKVHGADDSSQARNKRPRSSSKSYLEEAHIDTTANIPAMIARKIELEYYVSYYKRELQQIELLIQQLSSQNAHFPLGGPIMSQLFAHPLLSHLQSPLFNLPPVPTTDSSQTNGNNSKSKQSNSSKNQNTPQSLNTSLDSEEYNPSKSSAKKGKSNAPATPKQPPPPKKKMRDPDSFKFAQDVLKQLMNNINSPPFLKPVDPIKLNIPDYLTIIKKPMDFGTIRTRLNSRQYEDLNQFAADIRLVFENCRTYNLAESLIVKMCDELANIFDTAWAKRPEEPSFAKVPADVVSEAPKEKTAKVVTAADREKLKEDVMQLSVEYQSKFADLFMSLDPSTKVHDDEIELDIDGINDDVFVVLRKNLDEWLKAEKDGDGAIKSEEAPAKEAEPATSKDEPKAKAKEESKAKAEAAESENDNEDEDEEEDDDNDSGAEQQQQQQQQQQQSQQPRVSASTSANTSAFLGFSSDSDDSDSDEEGEDNEDEGDE